MKQPNSDPKPRAYGVAMAICAQLPQFSMVIGHEHTTDSVAYTLRRRDGAGLNIAHHPGYPRGQRDINISVEKVPEAPYGLEAPSVKYISTPSQTDAYIAFGFMMNHYEAMQRYWMVALAARQAALDHFNERFAFARGLAATGNGTVRQSDRNTSPGHVPSTHAIDCYSNDTSLWRVKYFHYGSTELIIHATDAQALAIVAMLAGETP
jgi:hypothetical protein